MTADATPGAPLATPALSAEALFARVRALEPRVAVFDCDGTLWAGDAGSDFMHWTMHTGLLSRDSTDWLTRRYAAYKAGDVSEIAICGEMVQIYAGLRVDELRRAAAVFFRERMERLIFPEMLTLVRQLQAEGADLWAVSSTCDWVIEEGLKRFGIGPERTLAACVVAEDGVATSRLRAVPSDEGKVEALRQAGITAPDAVFGNSVHDAAMLTIARGPFAINPSAELLTRSGVQGWPVFFPAHAGPVSSATPQP